MTKIAHASGDERHKLSGGKAGDQASEVTIRSWYNRPWNVVLHWKDPIAGDRCATAMERATANQKIGYDQSQRNTALAEARKYNYDPALIDTPCETDCSALVSLACMYAGIPEKVLYVNKNSSTTSTLRKRLMSTGLFEERTSDKYTKSPDYNTRGDILLYEGHHVAVQIETGDKVHTTLIPDVSHYHPVIDWIAVKETCPLIISKATQGTSYTDPTLDDFIAGCEKHKIPYWLYAYLNKGGELSQTKYLVNTCKDKVGEYFVGYVLDVEADNESDKVKKALDWLMKKKYRAMLYTGYEDYGMYKNIVNITLWWEARYGKNTGTYDSKYPCHDNVNLHQYTSRGECSGIKGVADLNRIVKGTLADFTEHMNAPEEPVTGKFYEGKYPVFATGRDCYKYGDGITSLKNYPTQIKRVQMLINWILTGFTAYSKLRPNSIKVDGKYGHDTETAVKKAQKVIGANVDGVFGQQTLRLAKKFKR